MINKVYPNTFGKLEQRVLTFIRQNRLAERQTLLVAVSGGPDSVCLLHILYILRKELDLSLHVVHLDHQLRGLESEADAKYVVQLAQQLDIPATVEARDVTSYQTKRRLSPEEAAREVRYSFIAEVAAAIKTGRVAVGHTQDDNIETILMHLIRGTGTRGLIGLLPTSRWQLEGRSIEIIRPLLTINREETQRYCEQYKLKPRIDSTNLSLSPLRNKIRLQLLPLVKSYNPKITGALLRTAKIAADELDFMSSNVAAAWENAIRVVDNTAVINKKRFVKLHPALQRHLVRKAIETVRSGAASPLKDIEESHIEEIISALRKPAGKMIQLPYGLVFTVEYNRYLLGPDPAALSPFPPFSGEYILTVPGLTQTGDWVVKTEIIEPERMKKGYYFTAYFDLEKIPGRLSLGTCRSGDRFQPFGMSQQKKLGEFMIDARIPYAWRRRIPILRSPGQIIWVVGYRIDERVKVNEQTKKVLKVTMRKKTTNK